LEVQLGSGDLELTANSFTYLILLSIHSIAKNKHGGNNRVCLHLYLCWICFIYLFILRFTDKFNYFRIPLKNIL